MKTKQVLIALAVGIFSCNAFAYEMRTGQTPTSNSSRFCAKREAKRLYEGQVRSAPVRPNQKAARAS